LLASRSCVVQSSAHDSRLSRLVAPPSPRSRDVKSDEEKRQAGELAQAAAPGRVVANELAVRPEGAEGTGKTADANVDDAIEHNFKAVIAARHWDNQHIRFNAKNGVLT